MAKKHPSHGKRGADPRKGKGPPRGDDADLPLSPPRIIGGSMRGRKLIYSGDPRTRPMKERVREAVFNLVGPSAKDKHAIDLFAGTGALGLEAISRGAARASFIERHFPTADVIRENAASLGVLDRCTIHPANTFLWLRRMDLTLPEWQDTAWVVFCSPPYSLYVDEHDAMLQLIQSMLDAAPMGSVFVIEADEQFDRGELSAEIDWDLRDYPPARIAWGKKEAR